MAVAFFDLMAAERGANEAARNMAASQREAQQLEEGKFRLDSQRALFDLSYPMARLASDEAYSKATGANRAAVADFEAKREAMKQMQDLKQQAQYGGAAYGQQAQARGLMQGEVGGVPQAPQNDPLGALLAQQQTMAANGTQMTLGQIRQLNERQQNPAGVTVTPAPPPPNLTTGAVAPTQQLASASVAPLQQPANASVVPLQQVQQLHQAQAGGLDPNDPLSYLRSPPEKAGADGTGGFVQNQAGVYGQTMRAQMPAISPEGATLNDVHYYNALVNQQANTARNQFGGDTVSQTVAGVTGFGTDTVMPGQALASRRIMEQNFDDPAVLQQYGATRIADGRVQYRGGMFASGEQLKATLAANAFNGADWATRASPAMQAAQATQVKYAQDVHRTNVILANARKNGYEFFGTAGGDGIIMTPNDGGAAIVVSATTGAVSAATPEQVAAASANADAAKAQQNAAPPAGATTTTTTTTAPTMYSASRSLPLPAERFQGSTLLDGRPGSTEFVRAATEVGGQRWLASPAADLMGRKTDEMGMWDYLMRTQDPTTGYLSADQTLTSIGSQVQAAGERYNAARDALYRTGAVTPGEGARLRAEVLAAKGEYDRLVELNAIEAANGNRSAAYILNTPVGVAPSLPPDLVGNPTYENNPALRALLVKARTNFYPAQGAR